ncbi:MAG TPA: SDR family NAD(P)-dependent oxidoreductase [Pseudomonadales bacterium]
MTGRLHGKIALIVGAGQTPGATIGNGRATALRFAQEGAAVFLVDRRVKSAEETLAMVVAEGGSGVAHEADVTSEAACKAMVDACVDRYGRIDILHNNVGIGAGDRGPTNVTEEVWDRIHTTNLKSVMFACKHALPVMRAQHGGVIINISSIAAVCSVGMTAYKTSKAAVNAFTQSLAIGNGEYNIRANVIMPGLMNTPMAIEGNVAAGRDRATVIAQRDAQVPLGHAMGSGWDVANAALFLASDEARFITGVCLAVDGGQSARIG